jgi:hypothetical protein
MDDPADDATIVDPPRPRLVLRQMRLNGRPLPIIQPKFVRHDSRSTLGAFLNHTSKINQSSD